MLNGDFGPFDEGYYGGVQSFGQEYGGFADQANQRYMRPRSAGGNTGKG
jgi:hypothetical protein